MAKIYNINCNMALQMAFKVFNNSIGPNGLISILLIFEAYFWMINSDALLLTIIQYSIALCKAIEKIKKLKAEC